MRTNVSFTYPAEFLPLSDEDVILSVDGARWFAELLGRIPGLRVDGELCQEDWGVVAFASRGEMRFWIGLSSWPDLEQGWLAHLHHGSFAWLQRFRPSAQRELERLASDLHDALQADGGAGAITWYHESDMRSANPRGAPSPRDP